MKEIQSLIARAEKYLATTDLLIESGDYESCVSRAYYAMFFCAQAALMSKGLSFSSHKGVISAFGQHFVKSGIFARELGKELNRAFDLRQLADYEHTFVISREKAQESLEHCRMFLKRIRDYLQHQGLL
ncbi:HEPN domain-containing protein [bacterium]|nr:HEPN domain-containing protein [bacterium]